MVLKTLKWLRLRAQTSLSILILGDLILPNDVNAIYTLMTPKFLSSAQTSSLNCSLIYPTTYLMFHLDA